MGQLDFSGHRSEPADFDYTGFVMTWWCLSLGTWHIILFACMIIDSHATLSGPGGVVRTTTSPSSTESMLTSIEVNSWPSGHPISRWVRVISLAIMAYCEVRSPCQRRECGIAYLSRVSGATWVAACLPWSQCNQLFGLRSLATPQSDLLLA